MSFIFKMMLVLYQCVSLSGVISNIYWHASKWSSISFSHWLCPSDREFSFPRFVGGSINTKSMTLTIISKVSTCVMDFRFQVYFILHTYIPLTLYPRRGSRGFWYYSETLTFRQNYLAMRQKKLIYSRKNEPSYDHFRLEFTKWI
jgi:hypothetical protein